MKRNDCSIVQDLLPLYIEDMLRPDTTDFVENHLSGCEVCTAALGDLKAETASPIPTPDVAETRQADQQVLKGLKKHLWLQRLAIALAFVYFCLFFFPWTNYKWAGPGLGGAAFTWFPVLMAAVLACRRDELSRNMALVATGMVLPTILFPLCFFIAYYGQTLHFPSGEQLDYVIQPVFWLALPCGLLLTGIALRNIWRKAIPRSADHDPKQKLAFRCALVAVGCIVLSPVLPLVFSEKAYYYSLLLFNLILSWPTIYLTCAIVFCQVTHKAEATRATVLALLLPAYAMLPSLAWFFPVVFRDFTWMDLNDHALLFFYIPYLVLSCILSAIAICSVWYQFKKTKEDHK